MSELLYNKINVAKSYEIIALTYRLYSSKLNHPCKGHLLIFHDLEGTEKVFLIKSALMEY